MDGVKSMLESIKSQMNKISDRLVTVGAGLDFVAKIHDFLSELTATYHKTMTLVNEGRDQQFDPASTVTGENFSRASRLFKHVHNMCFPQLKPDETKKSLKRLRSSAQEIGLDLTLREGREMADIMQVPTSFVLGENGEANIILSIPMTAPKQEMSIYELTQLPIQTPQGYFSIQVSLYPNV